MKDLYGLSVEVYHSQHDYALNHMNGIKNAVIVGSGMPELVRVRPDEPALWLVINTYHGVEYRHLEPTTYVYGWSFGGNFAWTSDSRFPNQYPLPIHDRRE